MKCYFYGTYCMNKAIGKVEYNGKVINICTECAWELYDEVDGDIEIVETL